MRASRQAAVSGASLKRRLAALHRGTYDDPMKAPLDISRLLGRTLGRYVVLEELGEGGMGVVYKARDTQLGRIIALKIMRQDGSVDPDRMRRFVREAQTASSLNHPNILTVYEMGSEAGLDYIATEYLAGPTLADLLSSGALPRTRTLRLAVQIADALATAHAAHIVHRDLKPSNIIVLDGDRVKVVDFGLAKLTDFGATSDETLDAVTAKGMVIGTAPYMSPEQASARPVDARSDLFSFGTILYEMLAGRRPFTGDSGASVLAAVLRDSPSPIPGLPADLAAVLSRCLRKDPDERFQSASELKAAIEACLAPAPIRSIPSIAVLPFTNMSGEKCDDYLCEGLAEEIINVLTRLPGLRVVARTSAFAVARMGLDVREAGARLAVTHVLEGSVRRAGLRVRVTTQLVSSVDGAHLWSESYDRELTDVLMLEDEVAAAVSARLRGEMSGAAHSEDSDRPLRAVNAKAHHAFLEGRHYFAKGTPEALAAAKACYQRAIAEDPSFALAYDSLAELYWFLGFFGAEPPREAFSQSTWHILRALELDEGRAEAHALLGMLRKELDYNWPEVDREFSRAFALDPHSPLVQLRHAMSCLMPRGRVEEAMVEIELILASDPLSLFVRWWLGVMAILARQFDRAIDEGRHMIALEPGYFLGHWTLGLGLQSAGRTDEAIPSLERAHELSGGTPFTLGFLAWAYGRAGRRGDATALLFQIETAVKHTYVPPFTFALVYAGLDDWDAAFVWMDRAVDARDPLIMPIRTLPIFDPIRGDPRFAALLEKMNLVTPAAAAPMA
jgi:eukaryotic-like serine/threonine-protein kinase